MRDNGTAGKPLLPMLLEYIHYRVLKGTKNMRYGLSAQELQMMLMNGIGTT